MTLLTEEVKEMFSGEASREYSSIDAFGEFFTCYISFAVVCVALHTSRACCLFCSCTSFHSRSSSWSKSSWVDNRCRSNATRPRSWSRYAVMLYKSLSQAWVSWISWLTYGSSGKGVMASLFKVRLTFTHSSSYYYAPVILLFHFYWHWAMCMAFACSSWD